MTQHSDIELDLSGLTCPMPLLKTKQALNKIDSGSIVTVIATDPASVRDFKVFSEQSGVLLLSSEIIAEKFIYRLQKP